MLPAMTNLDEANISEIACDYLPDSRRQMNRTEVYIKTQLTAEIWNVEAAIRYMRDRLPSPLQLRKVSPHTQTVVLLACSCPRILIGRAVPRDRSEEDIQEILDVLESHGVHGEVHS